MFRAKTPGSYIKTIHDFFKNPFLRANCLKPCAAAWTQIEQKLLALNLGRRAPIVGNMQRIAILAVGCALAWVPMLRAQDAATEERFNRLAGQIEDMRSNQEALGRRLDAIAHEIESLRGKLDKPSGNFATEEDLKALAESVKEIDRKRLEDYEKIRTELKNLGRSLATSAPAAPRKSAQASVSSGSDNSPSASSEKTTATDKGFEYQVKKGDNLSLIVKAYQDNNIKVTMDQILKANPGLKPEKLRVGQKIFIPAPPS